MKNQLKAFIAKFISKIADTPLYWFIKLRFDKFFGSLLKVQSKYFMNKILANVPAYIFEDVIRVIYPRFKLKIGDIGCGNGDGTKTLYRFFRNSEIIGYDFAIRNRFKNGISFINADINSFNHHLDIGILSNILEHFDYPIQIIGNLTKNIDNIIILVPYKETIPVSSRHKYYFNEHSFPEQIKSHKRTLLKVIDCNDSEYGYPNHILIIYTKI